MSLQIPFHPTHRPSATELSCFNEYLNYLFPTAPLMKKSRLKRLFTRFQKRSSLTRALSHHPYHHPYNLPSIPPTITEGIETTDIEKTELETAIIHLALALGALSLASLDTRLKPRVPASLGTPAQRYHELALRALARATPGRTGPFVEAMILNAMYVGRLRKFEESFLCVQDAFSAWGMWRWGEKEWEGEDEMDEKEEGSEGNEGDEGPDPFLTQTVLCLLDRQLRDELSVSKDMSALPQPRFPPVRAWDRLSTEHLLSKALLDFKMI